jgi:two-component system chemotaxis sensor kinase CheA
VRGGKIAPTPGVIKVMLSAFDMLADHVASAKGLAARPADQAALAALDAVLATRACPIPLLRNSAPAVPGRGGDPCPRPAPR